MNLSTPRSLGNLLELYQLLKHHDVELVSMSDRLSSADPNSKTFFTVKGMVADFGNDAHSERTKRGLEARARDLFSTGHKPYGYDSTPTQTLQRKGREVSSHFKIEINPTKADVVRKIFTLYAQGFGKCYIAKQLNAEKIAPPKPTSIGWRTGPLDNILRNEKYIGKWIFNKSHYSINPDTGRRVQKVNARDEWIIHQREDLRIIPQEIWDKVHKRFDENQQMRRKKAPTREQQIFGKRNRVDNLGLLTGVIVCSECGGACALVTGTRGGYYGCVEAHRHGTCKHKFLLKKTKAEAAVVEYIKEKFVSDPQAIKHVTERYNELVKNHLRKNPSRKKEVELELGQLSKEISNLIHFITSGNASDVEAIAKALKERESRKEKIERELAGLEYTDNRNLLVTPYLIKERLAELVDKIVEKSDHYNGTLKAMLEKPLVLIKDEEHFKLTGRMDIGLALAQSSRQCLAAPPNGRFSNRVYRIQ
jgi:site-specific DNA recombinase